MKRILILLIVVCACAGAWYAWRQHSRVEIVNARPTGRNVIAFGDSLTAGQGASPGQDYPSQLSRMAGITVLNRGVPGETTAEALRRLDSAVLAEDPRIVIVFLGGNDLLRRVPENTTFANLEKIVRAIQARGALVVLVGLKDSALTDNYNAKFRDVARRCGAVLVPDVLKGILDNPKLKSDQVHPNAAGYRVVAERIHERLRPHLEIANDEQ